MPPQNNPTPPAGSPFEIVSPGKSKKVGSKGFVVALVTIGFLLLSVVAGVLLVRQQQNIQEKAYDDSTCPGAEQCPNTNDRTLLQSCHTVDGDGTTTDSLCNGSQIGRKETCGTDTTYYCCNGTSWTTNMSACATPTTTASPSPTESPSPTASPRHTASPTASPTVTPTGSSTPTASATATATTVPTTSATPRPIPETGIEWPTVFGIGVGAAAIIISILVAL